MTDTQTPPETARRRGVIIALIAAAALLVFLIVGALLLAVLGIMVVAPGGSAGDPVPVVETIVAPAAIPDGEMFVFVTNIAGNSVTVDPARMLTGRQARETATAEGVISPGEDLPNDFYISNPDPETMALPVADETEVTVLGFDSTGDIEEVGIALSDLAVAFTGEYSGVPIYGLVAGEFPMTVTVEGGTVVEMTQVYLP